MKPCDPTFPRHDAELESLARIEGQVRGVQNMIAEGRYCIDILTQTRAIHAALRRVERSMLQAHLRTCVRESFASDDDEDRERKAEEVLALFDWENGKPSR